MRIFSTISVLFLCVLLGTVPLHAQNIQKTLFIGQSEVYGFDRMTTAAVGSPLIADIVPLSSHELMVNAKSLGVTTLFVCDHAGTHRFRLVVIPEPIDFRLVAARVQSAIGLPGVTAYAVQDTIFLEGAVSGPVALQRASAIAGVYAAKIKNLLTLVPDKTASMSPAQTYAALLTPALTPLGITVQVVDDKTIALSGQYASRTNTSGIGSTLEVSPSQKSPEPEITLTDDTKPSSKQAAKIVSPDLLNHLIQSLPPDLKVVNLLNLGPGPTRQILIRAKIIEMVCKASAKISLLELFPALESYFLPGLFPLLR
ncbi:MAG: pilus assembly protein N-terminal domain-containing protein [Janthinobacterium lividum]